MSWKQAGKINYPLGSGGRGTRGPEGQGARFPGVGVPHPWVRPYRCPSPPGFPPRAVCFHTEDPYHRCAEFLRTWCGACENKIVFIR